jgi:cytochrome c556
MKRVVKLSLLAICSSVTVTAALAQDAAQSPEQQAQAAVDTRQGLQKVMGFEMAPLGNMLKNKQPFDAAVIAKNAANIAALASMQPDIFAPDTRKFNLKTKAREGIWTNKADFDAKSNDLVKAANEAAMVAKSGGDKDALKKSLLAIGKGCAGCHDNFRDK